MRCNEIKGRLDDEEFSALLALIAGWPSEGRTDVLLRLRAGRKHTHRKGRNVTR
jgi:hypothetical protein